MSEVVPAPVAPAETDNLLNMGEGDSPSAPPLEPGGAVATQMAEMQTAVQEALKEEEEEQQVYHQTPAPPPPPGLDPPDVHEQAFVHAPAPEYHETTTTTPSPAVDGGIPQQQQQQEPPPLQPPTVDTQPPPPTVEDNGNNKRASPHGDDNEDDDGDDGDDGDGPPRKLKRTDSSSGSGGKKRGRKPGSLNKKKYAYNLDRGGPMPSWNDMFFALMAFKAKLGTFNVPAQTKLGKWVTKNRQEYSKLQRKKIDYNQCSELSEERIQVLNSLGFIWDTMLHENGRRWNQRFEELKQWKEEHGHCNVPQSTSLGQWVKIQRENKREADLKAAGKLPQRTKPKPCLAPDRIEKLNAIGFQWRVAAPVTGWDNRYNQLLEYAKTHNGDVNVPQYYPADKAFGRWVMKQRSEYSLRLRGLKSQLTDERVEKLNAIGFSWVAPNFKRKVGVGIAPGSPAAQAAMAQPAAPVAKLPPMEKAMLDAEPAANPHNPTMVPQPVPAVAAAAPPPPAALPPLDPTHNPVPQHAPPPLPPPQMVHHAHPPPPAPMPMEAPGEFPALHHDPHQPQPPVQHAAHHPHHLAPQAHHATDPSGPPPPPEQQPPPQQHHYPQHPPPPPHEAIGEDGISMEFL